MHLLNWRVFDSILNLSLFTLYLIFRPIECLVKWYVKRKKRKTLLLYDDESKSSPHTSYCPIELNPTALLKTLNAFPYLFNTFNAHMSV